MRHRSSRRRVQLPSSPGRNTKHEPARRQSRAALSTQEILARYMPGTAPPLKVLDVFIELFNTLHTSLEKTVSHKIRQERAQFLRRFFRDLNLKAGFKTARDPRNPGQKHIHAMVQEWHDERLAPATIQPYLFPAGAGAVDGQHRLRARARENAGARKVSQSVSQSVNRSISQSVNQSISQS